MVRRARDIALRFPAPGPCVIFPEIASEHKVTNSSCIRNNAPSTSVIWNHTYPVSRTEHPLEYKYNLAISIVALALVLLALVCIQLFAFH